MTDVDLTHHPKLNKKKPLTVLLCNLGTPSDPSPKGVRAFLTPFLSDRRVVEVPRLIWLMILHGIILPFRLKRVSQAYQSLWDEYGDSPLRLHTQSQVKKLQTLLINKGHNVDVDYVFTYGQPELARKIEKYRKTSEKILLLPLYPQYSCSTTAAIYDQLAKLNTASRYIANVQVVNHYYHYDSFRKSLVHSLESFWAEHGRGDHLLCSFHGVPQAYFDKGDPYYCQCMQTSKNLREDLGLDSDFYSTSFQSRLGKAKWLQPYTDKSVVNLAEQGVKVLDVICPSFSADCLETLEEITIENGQYFTEAGGKKLRLVPCMNDSDEHVAMMYDIIAKETPLI